MFISLECSEHMMVDMGALNSQNKDDRLEFFQQLRQGNPGHYCSNVLISPSIQLISMKLIDLTVQF